ncbi:MAG: NTP transferase domain-containing protein [Myxococcales bacterium]|nr:NTP transferase domain-containing protein [Myxococcales bacterium]
MAETAVILAAGMGSRLAPSGTSEQFSKPLMAVGGKTLLERTIGCCRAAGARRVVVVTGFRHELVEAEVARLTEGDVETVHNPDWTKSNGVSVYACRELLAEPFALMMSDHVFDPSILTDLLALTPPDGSVTLAVDHKIGEIFDLDDATKVVVDNGAIVAISKSLPSYNAIDCGLFLCTPAIFAALGEVVAKKGDTTLSEGMAIIGGRGQFLPFDIGDRWWQDVDTPEMLAQAASELARRGYLDR